MRVEFHRHFLGLYVLDEHGEPKAELDFRSWSRWFEGADRHVSDELARGESAEATDAVRVSTVFLGIDHNFFEKGPPVLWESMVFGGPFSGEQMRCAGSREQAEAMHVWMVSRVRREDEPWT